MAMTFLDDDEEPMHCVSLPDDEDTLAPSRGIVRSVLIGAALWVVAIVGFVGLGFALRAGS